ncbi:hypothetical protein E2320_004724 [Naja naja]|nr:hypothetical protein E2320_004724 [Naja naja]
MFALKLIVFLFKPTDESFCKVHPAASDFFPTASPLGKRTLLHQETKIGNCQEQLLRTITQVGNRGVCHLKRVAFLHFCAA